MLTFSQAQIVAYMYDGGFSCPKCAAAEHGSHAIELLDAGLATLACLPDVSPISRYELDAYNGEVAYEGATEGGLEDEAADDFAQAYPDECCSDCGAAL